MRKLILSLLLLAGAATTASLAFAGVAGDWAGGREPLYRTSHSAAAKYAGGLGTQSTAATDTLYVGYTQGLKSTANPWSLQAKLGSAGGHRPPANGAMWNWDPAIPASVENQVGPPAISNGYVNGDSLQGWWPIRLQWRYLMDTAQSDWHFPGNAIDIGNLTNYYPVNGRTFGVVGVWHRDQGGDSTGVGTAVNGTASHGVGWAALAGNFSAWCGLRTHGDPTAPVDGITGNPFTADAAIFNVHIRYSGTASIPKFPGYVDQWDQMLYRDIDMSGHTGDDLTVGFTYATRMSTGIDLCGWFDKDPLTTTSDLAPTPNPCALQNYISSFDTGNLSPVDSFMVYVGMPVDTTFQPYQSTCAPAVGRLPVYDPLRRWFDEVVEASASVNPGVGPNWGESGKVIELLSASGINGYSAAPGGGTTVSVTLPNSQISSLLKFGKIRLVFRVKTNSQSSDVTNGGYNSRGRGAAQVDNVTYSTSGGLSSPLGWGDFEAAGSIDNTKLATAAWRSTGKPPEEMTHIAKLNTPGNPYADLCGADPTQTGRVCSMSGGIIAFGLADNGNTFGDPNAANENHEVSNGIMSPTIQLCGPYPNVLGITAPAPNNPSDAEATSDMLVDYETYTQNATANQPPLFTGITYRWLLECYPQLTLSTHPTNPNAPEWGNLVRSFANYQTDAICFRSLPGITGQEGNMLSLGMFHYSPTAATQTTTSLFPDSIKIGWHAESQCWAAGVTNCNPIGGLYIDNVSLCLVDGTPLPISAEIWNFFQTAFPWNEAVVPAFAASFDTAGILVKTGLNIGPPNALNTFDVPGDSIVAAAASDQPMRMDLVFRILPGPGDYVQTGVPSSGLAVNAQTGNPTTGVGRTAVTGSVSGVPNVASSNFWESYLANNGPFGTPGGHNHANPVPGKWDPNVWNSARCDTTFTNIFPRSVGAPSGSSWQSTYHESELGISTDALDIAPATPAGLRSGLGLPRHKCFLSAANADLNSIDCLHDPPAVGADYDLTWVTATGSGYDGNPNWVQGTKIIPDGLLTPGAHVEYFWRKSHLSSGALVADGTMPDTTIVVPQVGERNNDGHRWCGFGALPDRWKQSGYAHPLGLVAGNPACILAVNDQTTNGSDWLQWVSVADTIGATSNQKWGAEIGFHAKGGGLDINNPANNFDRGHASGYPAEHGGNPGTTWDGYQTIGAEDTNPAGSIGGRYAIQDASNTQIYFKREQGSPSLEQLKTFYKVVLWFTGNLSASVLGPSGERGANDAQFIKDWLLSGSPASANRAFWATGDGFVSSNEIDTSPDQPDLDLNYFGVGLVNGQYRLESGNTKVMSYFKPVAGNALALWGSDGPTWTPPQTPGTADKTEYVVRNTCTHSNDVLKVASGAVVSQVFTNYEDPNPSDAITYASGIYKPFTATKPWISLIDGMGIMDVIGRNSYYYKVLVRVFGGVCPTVGSPAIPLDVPNLAEGSALADFVNLRNNPLASGMARIHFGLSKDDHVQIKVFDVTGREVRVLADRDFKAGEHDIVWDGSDNGGRPVARGVYFTQVRYRNSAFSDAKKLTVLK